MLVRFDHLSNDELDRQFSPSLSAKDAAGVLRRHEAETAALGGIDGLTVVRDVAYGDEPRQRYDVVRPSGHGPFPALLFIHGGFWQEGSKAGSGFCARSLAEAGWATVLLGYALAPQARLADIVDETGAALLELARLAGDFSIDPSRLVVAGHSAGAYLAAALLCGRAGDEAAELVAGAVLVSGVYDLAPVAASYVNDLLGLDGAEARALSVIGGQPRPSVPIRVIVGADETEAFRVQSSALFNAWRRPGVDLCVLPGRDHFDILDELGEPSSPAFAANLGVGE